MTGVYVLSVICIVIVVDGFIGHLPRHISKIVYWLNL